jgi:transcriptional regulator with XRE-family HTH domain
MEPVQPPSVGRNIQRIRKQQQLTLGVLAERSGVSKAMLSQIESEKVNPTVATVWKIARGLEVELDELLKGAEVPVRKFLVAGQEEHTTLDGPQGAPRIEVLSPLAMAEDLEIYLLTFERGAVLRSSPHAPQTEEYLTVIEGKVKVSAGDKSSDLEAGDFIIYNCDVEHSIENLAGGPSRVHMIVRFVRRQWD